MYKLSLAVLLCIVLLRADGQGIEKYKFNVIKFSKVDYGFIIGSTLDNFCYMVVVQSANSPLAATLSASIHQQYGKSRPATKLHEFEIDKYTLGIYRLSSRAIPVEDRFYSSVQATGPYKTFADLQAEADNLNVVADNVPSDLVDQENQAPSPSVVVLKTDPKGIFYEGMPVVDARGNVVALVAEQKTGNKRFYNAITLSAIYQAVQKLEARDGMRCKYFTLLRSGESMTPCDKEAFQDKQKREQLERERKAKKLLSQKQRREYRQGKFDTWSFGPSISAHYNLSRFVSDEGSFKFNYVPVTKYTAGMNLYLNPDQAARFVLQPSYSIMKVGTPPGTTITSNSGFALNKIEYRMIELPILLEVGTRREKNVEYYWAMGYQPSLQLNAKLSYRSSTQKKAIVDITDPMQYNHLLLLRTGLCYKHTRFTLGLSHSLTPFKERDYTLEVDGERLEPFTTYKKLPLQIGLEVAWRLKGIWGIKHKLVPSEFLKK